MDSIYLHVSVYVVLFLSFFFAYVTILFKETFLISYKNSYLCIFWLICGRAVRYDDIYWMDEIKSLSFHIMFYHLFRGVVKYIVYGNTFSSFEWLRSLYAAHHGAWRGDRSRWRTTSQDTTRSSFLNEGLHL